MNNLKKEKTASIFMNEISYLFWSLTNKNLLPSHIFITKTIISADSSFLDIYWNIFFPQETNEEEARKEEIKKAERKIKRRKKYFTELVFKSKSLKNLRKFPNIRFKYDKNYLW
jgi:ribosome-binding factor A